MLGLTIDVEAEIGFYFPSQIHVLMKIFKIFLSFCSIFLYLS